MKLSNAIVYSIHFIPLIRAQAIDLGTAATFGALGAMTVTNTGPSSILGDLGVSPGTSVTGFPPGSFSGTLHSNDAVAAQAQADALTAYNVAAGLAPTAIETGNDLGGLTLAPGVYFFSSSAQLTGTLTLNGQGDTSALFVFQVGSTLTTAPNSAVTLINGAQACNVIWQVGSSATLGTDTFFIGNILAHMSISANTGASTSGSWIALTGAVTLQDNDIEVVDTCNSTSSSTTTSTSSSTVSSSISSATSSAESSATMSTSPSNSINSGTISSATSSASSSATTSPIFEKKIRSSTISSSTISSSTISSNTISSATNSASSPTTSKTTYSTTPSTSFYRSVVLSSTTWSPLSSSSVLSTDCTSMSSPSIKKVYSSAHVSPSMITSMTLASVTSAALSKNGTSRDSSSLTTITVTTYTLLTTIYYKESCTCYNPPASKILETFKTVLSCSTLAVTPALTQSDGPQSTESSNSLSTNNVPAPVVYTGAGNSFVVGIKLIAVAFVPIVLLCHYGI